MNWVYSQRKGFYPWMIFWCVYSSVTNPQINSSLEIFRFNLRSSLGPLEDDVAPGSWDSTAGALGRWSGWRP